MPQLGPSLPYLGIRLPVWRSLPYDFVFLYDHSLDSIQWYTTMPRHGHWFVTRFLMQRSVVRVWVGYLVLPWMSDMGVDTATSHPCWLTPMGMVLSPKDVIISHNTLTVILFIKWYCHNHLYWSIPLVLPLNNIQFNDAKGL